MCVCVFVRQEKCPTACYASTLPRSPSLPPPSPAPPSPSCWSLFDACGMIVVGLHTRHDPITNPFIRPITSVLTPSSFNLSCSHPTPRALPSPPSPPPALPLPTPPHPFSLSIYPLYLYVHGWAGAPRCAQGAPDTRDHRCR